MRNEKISWRSCIFLSTFYIMAAMLFLSVQYQASSEQAPGAIAKIDYVITPSVNHSPIQIDGDAALLTFPDKTGAGTQGNPYVIADLVIDVVGGSTAISISNTTAWLVIENCTIYNSGTGGQGLSLQVCQNITLRANKISNCNVGAYAYYSNNITITNNSVASTRFGILIENRCNDTIVSDNILSVSQSGITFEYMDGSLGSQVLNNNITSSGLGIKIDSSTILMQDNKILAHGGQGIEVLGGQAQLLNNSLQKCGIILRSNFISELQCHTIEKSNTVNGRVVYYYVHETGLNPINFTNAGQVILVDCGFSTVSGVNASNGGTGIYLLCSDNNTVTGNIASNNTEYGIYSFACVNNTISANNVSSNNWAGISLENSWKNTVTRNRLTKNHGDGIKVKSSASIVISNNIIERNGDNAIDMYISDSCSLSGNIVKENYMFAIWLISCDNNNITQNMVTQNEGKGICLLWCNCNEISGNTAWGNDDGLFLNDCDNNTIFCNGFWDNWISLGSISSGVGNNWTNGTHGNFWGDYIARYPNSGNDGITWDVPYPIPVQNSQGIPYFDGTFNGEDPNPLFVIPGYDDPLIYAPLNRSYQYYQGSSNVPQIKWIIADTTIGQATYAIYRNSLLVDQGSWISGAVIQPDFVSLPVDLYNFTIVVTDGLGGIARHMVYIGVWPQDLTIQISVAIIVGLGVAAVIVVMHFMRKRENHSPRRRERSTGY